MRHLLLSAATLATTALCAGVGHAESIKPTAPTWCGAYKADAYDTMYKYLEPYSKGGFTFRFMNTLAKASCDKPTDPMRQQEVATWREKFNAYYHLSESENRELLEGALAETIEPAATQVCNKLHETAIHASLEDRARLAAARVMLGCGVSDSSLSWWVDADPEISDPILKTVWVHDNLAMTPEGGVPRNPDDARSLIGYALAGHDAQKLDRGQLVGELEKLGVGGAVRLKALQFFGEVQTETERLNAYYRDKAKQDPNMKKVLFDVPNAAWDEWTKDATTWSAALEDERAIVHAARTHAGAELAGCSTKIRKHLAEYVAAKHPATQEAAIGALTDHIGYRLAMAALLCDAAAHDVSAFGIQKILEKARVPRGPRYHIYYALLGLGDSVPGFDPKYAGQIETSPVKELLYAPKLDGVSWAEPRGLIAGLSPSKDGVLVTFKTTRWNEAVWNCITTNRIDHFENGSAVYYQDCRTTGKTKPASSTEKPVLVAKDHAGDLKVGQFVMFVADANKKPAVGGPTFGYAKEDQKKLVSVLGIKL